MSLINMVRGSGIGPELAPYKEAILTIELSSQINYFFNSSNFVLAITHNFNQNGENAAPITTPINKLNIHSPLNNFERDIRIELMTSTWKEDILPLN